MSSPMTINNMPELRKTAAIPASVPAPDLTRTPPVVSPETPPRILIFYITENGAVAVGTGAGNNGAVEPNSGSAFEVQSKIGGFGYPKMTTAERDAIDVDSSTRTYVYNTTTETLDFYNGTSWIQSAAAIAVSIPNVPLTAVERDASGLVNISGIVNNAIGHTTIEITSGTTLTTTVGTNLTETVGGNSVETITGNKAVTAAGVLIAAAGNLLLKSGVSSATIFDLRDGTNGGKSTWRPPNGSNGFSYEAVNMTSTVALKLPTGVPQVERQMMILTDLASMQLGFGNAIDCGMVNLSSGVSAAITPDIGMDANTVILCGFGLKTPGAGNLTVDVVALPADRVNGEKGTGSFKLTAVLAAGTINVLDQSQSVMWVAMRKA